MGFWGRFLVGVFLILMPVSVRAQQADCLIGLLGKPLWSDSVRTALAELGIAYPLESAKKAVIALPSEGALLKTEGGRLTEVYLFNDSIPFKGVTYKRFRGMAPLGLTFSDSVGIEENVLFHQDAAEYGQHDDGLYYGRIQMESRGVGYVLEQGFLPQSIYSYYRTNYSSVKWHRTLYYRYALVKRVKGKYLDMPLICGSSNGGAFVARSRSTRADSSYYISLYGGYRNIATGGRVKRALKDGGYFGGSLMFPVSQRLSPPLHHVFGIEGAFFNYRDSTRLYTQQDGSDPSHTQLSFYYGLAAIPWLGPRPKLAPIAQVLGGLQLDYSPTLVNYAGSPLSSSSASLFYQIGAGLGYQFKSGFQIQALAQWRSTRFARYIRYDSAYPLPGGGYTSGLEVMGTRLRTFSVELAMRVNLVND